MKTRQKRFQRSIYMGLLALVFLVGGCTIDLNGDKNDDSPQPVTGPSEFVSAAPDSVRYALDGLAEENTAAPDARDEDAAGADAQREIEEADIIQIDGNRLYILNQYRGLFVCDIANPDNPRIIGRLSVSGEPVDMYIRDGRAYIIVSTPQYLYYGLRESADDSGIGIPDSGSRVLIVDVSNPVMPAMMGSVSLDGSVADSRIVGDILYVVSSQDVFYYDILPVDAVGPVRKDRENSERETFVASIDISSPDNPREVDRENLEGASQYIHVTDSAIFVPSTQGYYSADQTTIAYVDISDPAGSIVTRGNVSIPGSVQDKFKMDYANGYFRVCSYEWNREDGISNLYMIDVADPDNMTVAGSVELGRGEQLFATRFDGDRAYMVTFERVDPLHVIDLSDPANPRIVGELEVPGWSTHIEPRGDRLIALGVDNDNGWRVSISLFNVSDPAAPTLVQRVSFGEETGWSSSTAYGDVKALTVIDDMGLILLPYSTSTSDEGQYRYEDRLQLVDFSPEGLTARGWVAQKGSVLRSRNIENRLFSISGRQIQVIQASDRDNPRVTATLSLMENIVDFEPLANGYGVRLVQDDMGVSTLQAVPMSDPEYGNAAGEIALNANESFNALFVNGNQIYIVAGYWGNPYGEGDGDMIRYDYSYRGVTRVTVYDFSNPAAPVKRGTLDLEGSYSPISRPDIYGMLYPYYYPQGEFHRLGSNSLVFIQPPQNYDYPILYGVDDLDAGSDDGAASSKRAKDDEPDFTPYNEASEGAVTESGEPMLISGNPDGDDYTTALENENVTTVQVVDLSNPDAPVVVSRATLTYNQASGYFVNNGTLYFSYYTELENDAQGRPQTRYYLGRLDLTNPDAPAELSGVNIPGVCLGLDTNGVYGWTLNSEWTETGDSKSFTFNTIWLNNGNAYLQDTVSLGSPEYSWYYGYDYAITEGRAYFSGFGTSSYEETALKVIDTSAPADLKDHDFALNTGGWMDLMDASGNAVFLRISNSVACYDAARIDAFALDEYRSPGGWGNRIVFSGGKAYVPMGYYGLWVKDVN